MLIFNAKLVDVQDTGDYKSLVFRATKFDPILGETVVYRESVGISDECLAYLPNYKASINQTVSIAVTALVTRKGGIYLLSNSDILAKQAPKAVNQ